MIVRPWGMPLPIPGLTVSAAGSSQFELACAGSPAILLVVADNQLDASLQAVQQGWCDVIDMRESKSHDIVGQWNRSIVAGYQKDWNK